MVTRFHWISHDFICYVFFCQDFVRCCCCSYKFIRFCTIASYVQISNDFVGLLYDVVRCKLIPIDFRLFLQNFQRFQMSSRHCVTCFHMARIIVEFIWFHNIVSCCYCLHKIVHDFVWFNKISQDFQGLVRISYDCIVFIKGC